MPDEVDVDDFAELEVVFETLTGEQFEDATWRPRSAEALLALLEGE